MPSASGPSQVSMRELSPQYNLTDTDDETASKCYRSSAQYLTNKEVTQLKVFNVISCQLTVFFLSLA